VMPQAETEAGVRARLEWILADVQEASPR
jgi:hypothetical protein